MKLRGVFVALSLSALSAGLAACGNSTLKQPLNPPQLVGDGETSMSIQLYMQATILMARYFGYRTLSYETVREKSEKAGFATLPFMPPEKAMATPNFRKNTLRFTAPRQEGDRTDTALTKFQSLINSRIGYNNLVKYYISTGLRASQVICRNHLQGLEERNRYLDFLKSEFGVASNLSNLVLMAVEANGTLRNAMGISQNFVTDSFSAYEKYRSLSISYEEARVIVETAQNVLAQHFYQKVDGTLPPTTVNKRTIYNTPYTFADAINAVSVIENQCTRAGIERLVAKAVYATPPNMAVDPVTGSIVFHTNTIAGGDAAEKRSVAPQNATGMIGRTPPVAAVGGIQPPPNAEGQ